MMTRDDQRALIWLLNEHDRLKAENAMLWKENDELHRIVRQKNRREQYEGAVDLMLYKVERDLRREIGDVR
jgi:hypothetical protein